ncbi:hypothetical protein DDI_0544 [Dickeya dianthicola RNS04.9]|nr:hypothetical protein DDI_0544 [Dickeya dianthicola RNS04.9]
MEAGAVVPVRKPKCALNAEFAQSILHFSSMTAIARLSL